MNQALNAPWISEEKKENLQKLLKQGLSILQYRCFWSGSWGRYRKHTEKKKGKDESKNRGNRYIVYFLL